MVRLADGIEDYAELGRCVELALRFFMGFDCLLARGPIRVFTDRYEVAVARSCWDTTVDSLNTLSGC